MKAFHRRQVVGEAYVGEVVVRGVAEVGRGGGAAAARVPRAQIVTGALQVAHDRRIIRHVSEAVTVGVEVPAARAGSGMRRLGVEKVAVDGGGYDMCFRVDTDAPIKLSD